VRTRAWRWTRRAGALILLALIVWRFGTGPFLAGLRAVRIDALLAALAITALTTVCSAWRWRLVSRGLGVDLPLRAATLAYYRSQFLNSALPGGVLGDLGRALRQGRDAGDARRGIRAVAWDRLAGQAVQVAVTLAVLLVLDSPLRVATAWVLPALAVPCAFVGLLLLASGRRPAGRWGRAVRAGWSDLRAGVLARRSLPGVTAASVLIAAGHASVFLIAAASTGTMGSAARVLPVALVVLMAMTVPLSIAGWGPREGAAAWAFSAAGLGAAQGVATATTYGVLALVAVLPGAAVILADRLRAGRAARA
jgi:uncharacterized membrane protein YbhN (UPF0104 family)